jgi:DNA-binding transcriptional regulator YdaS (Cro superfamily)
MATQALQQAIKIVGGQSALARELTDATGELVRQGNVWSWLNRTKKVPPEVAPHIESITAKKGTKVPRAELCPDFPWA